MIRTNQHSSTIHQHLTPRRASATALLACLLAGCLLAGSLLTGCFGGAGGPSKGNLSALWAESAESEQLDSALLSRLGDAHIQEVFMPLARIDFSDENPVSRLPMPDLSPTIRLNMVITGKLKLGGKDPVEAAEVVAASVQQMLFDVESRGLIPVGVHFDLLNIDSISIGAAFFEKLRAELDRSFFLSITLRRSWLEKEEIGSMMKAVDFVVPFLYGQRPSEKDATDAWDFGKVRQRLDLLEELQVPYMVGIIGIGTATHKDREGNVVNSTSEQSLHPFLWNRSLDMQRGFSLNTTNRRAYTLVAKERTRVGDWDIGPKDEIRLVRPMTTDLDQLLDVLAEKERPHLIGQLYYRLPTPDERLSISLSNILSALEATPIVPDLTFEVQMSRRIRGGALYRVIITNHNRESTEYSLLDKNYLQIRATANAFGNVEVGDFYRYNLLQMQPNGKFDIMFRDANAIRLHIPILDGQEQISTGDVEIAGRNPILEIAANFLMPDGRSIEFGPFTWKDGVLEGQEDRESDDPSSDASSDAASADAAK